MIDGGFAFSRLSNSGGGRKLLGTSASLVVTSALLVVTINSNSFLLLVVRHLLLLARHLLLVVTMFAIRNKCLLREALAALGESQPAAFDFLLDPFRACSS